MRSTRLIVAVVGAGVVASTSAAAVARPTLRVTQTVPFTVRGSHFEPLERVRVIVYAKSGSTRIVSTTGRGVFFVQFRNVEVGYCPTYAVSAIGTKGSRASFRFASRDCPPPPPPP